MSLQKSNVQHKSIKTSRNSKEWSCFWNTWYTFGKIESRSIQEFTQNSMRKLSIRKLLIIKSEEFCTAHVHCAHNTTHSVLFLKRKYLVYFTIYIIARSQGVEIRETEWARPRCLHAKTAHLYSNFTVKIMNNDHKILRYDFMISRRL